MDSFIALFCWSYNLHLLPHGALDVTRGLAADKVELGAARARAAQDLHLVYHRRVEREDLLHPYSGRDLADGKHRSRLGTVLDREYGALERLLADVLGGDRLFVGGLAGFKLDNVLPDAHDIARAQAEGRSRLHIDGGNNNR